MNVPVETYTFDQNDAFRKVTRKFKMPFPNDLVHSDDT